ncbi:MAG: DUF2357 domain-containing protein [Firmicutes bacterium]|nr:DUF2357 domain-containing protein [Bacillota bacterium]
MPPNKLPFQVILHLGGVERSASRPLINFCQKEKEAAVDYTYLLEFSNSNLEFSPAPGYEVPSKTKLYIDGLDGIESDLVQRDLDGAYLPCPCSISLYKSGENTYPWIPGQYRVKVVWGDKDYFTILRVRAKNMTDDQLEQMRFELENYVRGLAMDIVLQNQGIGTSEVVRSLPERFYQYHVIEREFPRLYATILDILQKPHQQASKKYSVLPVHRAKVWDNRTLRWLNSEQGRRKNCNTTKAPQFVLSPNNEIQFDLPENRWLKKILRDIIQVLGEIQSAIEGTLEQKKKELKLEQHFNSSDAAVSERTKQEINKLREDLTRCGGLQGQFWQLLNSFPLNEVKYCSGFIPITPGLQKDFRYWFIYRFWQQLTQHSEVQVQSAADYQWKRTDLLYEYWCFVKTMEAVRKLGFTPHSGWIFSHRWDFSDSMFIPSIEPGTQVTFYKDTWRLDLIYDQTVPYRLEEAKQREIPIWSESENNRPDMRLDLYRNGEYYRSIILEVKYRPCKNIWNYDIEEQRPKWSVNMRQLRNYRIGLSSIDDQDSRPVFQVLALFPGDKESKTVMPVEPYRIAIVQLTPGRDNPHFQEYLEQKILKELIC